MTRATRYPGGEKCGREDPLPRGQVCKELTHPETISDESSGLGRGLPGKNSLGVSAPGSLM